MKTNKPALDFRPCHICLSPYRREIEKQIADGKPTFTVAKEYDQYFPIERDTFKNLMYKHMKEHLKYSGAIMVLHDANGVVTPAKIETYAKKLMRLGLQMIDETPWVFEPKDIIAAQDLLLKTKTLSLQEDVVKMSMARIFGGVGKDKLADLDNIEDIDLEENEPARIGENTASLLPEDKE